MPGIQSPKIQELARNPEGVSARTYRKEVGVSMEKPVPDSAEPAGQPGIIGWAAGAAKKVLGL